MKTIKCPKGHGPMELKLLAKSKTFKGVDVDYTAEVFVCPACGLEAATVEAAGRVQRTLADAYRAKVGLLTGLEIRDLRESQGFTQVQLAERMNVGIASIKRWETGMIQSKSMDQALRAQLQGRSSADSCTGKRQISLSRIKLVARTFEKLLGKRLLKAGDRFLFLAKYLWYADMLAFRRLGRGLTGASYAALPYGPQLNNYRDLVQTIKAADVDTVEPLSEEERRVIGEVAEKFPDERDVFEAAHRERVWREALPGALIPYACAAELTEI
jgi:putative zinc finger/helix-turn-helix YgiT family protein